MVQIPSGSAVSAEKHWHRCDLVTSHWFIVDPLPSACCPCLAHTDGCDMSTLSINSSLLLVDLFHHAHHHKNPRADHHRLDLQSHHEHHPSDPTPILSTRHMALHLDHHHVDPDPDPHPHPEHTLHKPHHHKEIHPDLDHHHADPDPHHPTDPHIHPEHPLHGPCPHSHLEYHHKEPHQ